MLEKRSIKEGAINATYNSSNIKKTVYDESKKALVIIFNKGNMYMYQPVSKELYEEFEKAESQGKFFMDKIKKNSKITFIKLTKLKDFELNTF